MKVFCFISVLCFFVSNAWAQGTPDTLVPSSLIIPAKYATLYDSARTVYLPKGFQCSVFYTQAGYWAPRMMAIDPSGRLCVADQGLSRVLALPDTNHDGAADTAIVLAYNDSNAHSIAFYQGALYAAAPGFVLKFEHPNAAGLYVDSSRFIDNIPHSAQGATNHTTRTILFDTVANVIYLTVGSPCNACREIDTDRASVLAFNLDGSGERLYATGLRNAVGIGMDPATRDIWINVAERNSQGEDIPHDFAAHLVQHGFYGWPIAFGDHQWDNFQADSEYRAMLPITHTDSENVANMQVPDIYFDAHSTPLSLVFYRKQKFPAEYQGNMFTSIHGSANALDGRAVANGSKIMRSQNVAGQWITSDFATGFLTDSIHYLRWARPAGIIVDSAGDLYFSSDNTSPHATPAIFKISYVGMKDVESSLMPATSVEVYPNPASDHFHVDLGNLRVSSISIEDMLGREMLRKTNASSSVDFDIHNLAPGIYLLQVILRDRSFCKRFVVTR